MTVPEPLASPWWARGFAAVAATSVVLSGFSGAERAAAVPTAALTAAVLVLYAVLAALLLRRGVTTPAAVVTVVTVAGLTAWDPVNAVLQLWAFPALWALTRTTRAALLWTLAAAVAVFLGFAVGEPAEWPGRAGAIQLVSYAANLALGLWISRVEQRALLLAELADARGAVAELHREVGSTAERERLTRELHDTIAQSLAGTVLLVQQAHRRHRAGTLEHADLDRVEESARAALTETRALVAAGSAPGVGLAGLGATLGTVAERFRQETGLDVELVDESRAPLTREAQVALLRSAQECLANVRRHAAASGVRIVLVEQGASVVLSVHDDGCGFDPTRSAPGFGLSGLRERLALVGGALEVRSGPDGTEVRARVPREATG